MKRVVNSEVVMTPFKTFLLGAFVGAMSTLIAMMPLWIPVLTPRPEVSFDADSDRGIYGTDKYEWCLVCGGKTVGCCPREVPE